MNLPKEVTSVTPTSKFLAMFLFLSIPFVGFFIGIRYGQFTQYIESRADVEQYILRNQPTATQSAATANWNTYLSDEFGFEVKYPNNFVVDYETKDSLSVFSDNFASIEVGTIPTEENLNSYIDAYLEQSKTSFEGKPSLSVYKRSSLTISGKDAVQLELFYEALGAYGLETYITTGKNALIYIQTIDFKGGTTLDNEVKKLHNQILSTFQFTDEQTQSLPPCLADAKQCPDGSYVVRQPPTCEFAKCP